MVTKNSCGHNCKKSLRVLTYWQQWALKPGKSGYWAKSIKSKENYLCNPTSQFVCGVVFGYALPQTRVRLQGERWSVTQWLVTNEPWVQEKFLASWDPQACGPGFGPELAACFFLAFGIHLWHVCRSFALFWKSSSATNLFFVFIFCLWAVCGLFAVKKTCSKFKKSFDLIIMRAKNPFFSLAASFCNTTLLHNV